MKYHEFVVIFNYVQNLTSLEYYHSFHDEYVARIILYAELNIIKNKLPVSTIYCVYYNSIIVFKL